MTTPTLDVPTFIARWQAATLTERQGYQQHYLDLCRVLGHPTPAEIDATGSFYTFEKGAQKAGGGDGWADVWFRGHFAWEYKGKHKDLKAAYQQLLQYHDSLENPPLLVVCDLDRFEVHTKFTGVVSQVYAFDLADLARNQPTPTCDRPPLEVLRLLVTDPPQLRPGTTRALATEAAAAEFAKLAASLRERGAHPEAAARFLMRLLFCLFAEDMGLLPSGVFTRLAQRTRTRPEEFGRRLRPLFAAMATGGAYGEHDIAHFNGGLFIERAVVPGTPALEDDDAVLDLTAADLAVLETVGRLDWGSVEPAILGTLFERSLEPDKRSQLGAHYTGQDDIHRIVEPVLMAPLRRRWDAVRAEAEVIIARREAATTPGTRSRHQQALRAALLGFSDELAAVRVLDPACGSGNFLYVALKALLDLEKEVSLFGALNGLPAFFPQVGPHQLHGIETNVYAHQLASVVVWIGYLQWLDAAGFGIPSDPILRPLTTIQHRDAILEYDADDRPVEPTWPAVDVIIGNPPFLGDKKMRAELGDQYVADLRRLYAGRVPGGADLVCYWFEKARAQIEAGQAKRAGLLATQGIRGGQNRKVLDRIKQTGDIFWAYSDRDWILEGATVHVSIVGFDDGSEMDRQLDDQLVETINADLSSRSDLTTAHELLENTGLSFIGTQKGGPFDIDDVTARAMLAAPVNVNSRPNDDVIKPWVNAIDLTRRPRGMWIIDFVSMSLEQAALYELPFDYVQKHVKPHRDANRDVGSQMRWWLHQRPRPDLRRAIISLTRYIATPMVSKHRLFVWLPRHVVAENLIVVIARDDDYFLGILQSKSHELWSRAQGSQLREAESGTRYTPTTTFETYPFPWPPGQEPAGDARVAAIAAAARALVQQRDAWLNPPGASAAELKTRTLTNLYNQRPTWLALAHQALDAAVLAAYGWPADLGDDEVLARLLALNQVRAAGAGSEPGTPSLLNTSDRL